MRSVRPDALLALDTRTALSSSRQLDRLSAFTAVHVPDFASFEAAFHKSVCLRECRDLDIPCPQDFSIEEAREYLLRAPGSLTLVVKPNVDAVEANCVHYVRSAEMLDEAVQHCGTHFDGACVQEYIPVKASNMNTVVLLLSSTTRLIAAFTTRKLRQLPRSGGLTVTSRSTAASDLVAQVFPFFLKSGDGEAWPRSSLNTINEMAGTRS